MKTNETKEIAACIGVQVTARAEFSNYARCNVTLITTSGCDEGAYYPGQDINLYGIETVKKLQAFLTEVITSYEQHNKEEPK